ncbi:MAG: DUF86 domain-containing protein [Thiohalophilus sp.]|nr:DUF86 domain-containing protein [Thiohalophilus sp.]MDZ7804380.1 DUF86 domain-containing protein [Thiohalophilus sp.]
MDRALIEQKLESLRRCLQRVEEKCPQTVEELQSDPDAQDILTLNLSRAVQLCVDIGMHIIADTEITPPDTMGETFTILAQSEILDKQTAAQMRKAVGFRNIAVHNYRAIALGNRAQHCQTTDNRL